MNPLPVTDADLSAYVDGQLAPARAAEVDQALARDASVASRVADLRHKNAMLREAFDPWLAEPISQALLAAATRPDAGGWWRRSMPWFAAAATMVLGVAIGWYARDALLAREGTPT